MVGQPNKGKEFLHIQFRQRYDSGNTAFLNAISASLEGLYLRSLIQGMIPVLRDLKIYSNRF